MDYLIRGFNLSSDETVFLPAARFLREMGVEATMEPYSLDNIRLSRIIYSKW